MKKSIGLLIMMLMISSSCLAMTFSQPVEIGSFVTVNMGGFVFHSVSANDGTLVKNGRKGVYEQGIARFGSGSDALFFHYKNGTQEKRYSDYIMAFGGENIKNTVNVYVMTPQLYKINSDQGMTFYLIKDGYDLPEEECFILIGKRKDNTWVKYFSTTQITEKYFGRPLKVWSANSIYCDNFKMIGNTMIIEYQQYNTKQRKYIKAGEFRFKWDESAQWFGVEQVVY